MAIYKSFYGAEMGTVNCDGTVGSPYSDSSDVNDLQNQLNESVFNAGNASMRMSQFGVNGTGCLGGDSHTLYDHIVASNKYFIPIVVCIGLIGNSVSFLVFVSTGMRKLSTSVYLAALALTDSGFLFCLLFGDWIERVHDVNQNIHSCRLIIYLTYVFSFLSVWYVVSFTVERYIAVCYPLKRPEICTTQRAVVVTVALAVIAFGGYGVSMATVSVQTSDNLTGCVPNYDRPQIASILNYVDTVITLLVPSISLIYFNARIAYIIIIASKKRGSMMRVPKMHFRSERARHHLQMNITKMLLLVSVVFLFLCVPSYVIRLRYIMLKFINPNYIAPELDGIMQILSQMLYYTNFCINFFLYSFSGSNFRNELRYCCVRLHLLPQRTATLMSSWRSSQESSAKKAALLGQHNCHACAKAESYSILSNGKLLRVDAHNGHEMHELSLTTKDS